MNCFPFLFPFGAVTEVGLDFFLINFVTSWESDFVHAVRKLVSLAFSFQGYTSLHDQERCLSELGKALFGTLDSIFFAGHYPYTSSLILNKAFGKVNGTFLTAKCLIAKAAVVGKNKLVSLTERRDPKQAGIIKTLILQAGTPRLVWGSSGWSTML